MNENIGYEIPPSLKYEERIFAGMTRRQLVYLISAVAACVLFVKLTGSLAVYGQYYKFILIICLCSILTFFGCVCQFRLDAWLLTVKHYIIRGKKINRFDKEMLNFLTLRSVNYDHYFNVYGDACSILKIYTLTGDRSDAKNADKIRQLDTDFLNSLPCQIQILGYSSLFDIEKYTSMVLNNAKLLPDDQQKLMIGHLNHIKQYCNDQNVRDKMLYMIIKTPVNSLNQIEKLNIDTNTIIKGLSRCFVVGELLTGTALTNTHLMISCGVGREGIDYLSDCVTLED